jgi:Zn-dependent peptidase ImmA (M78 family)/transcriptional regulator with XRE-family HTH domain
MPKERGRNVPETAFGVRLRAARKMAGLSMEDLAGKLGGVVTKQAISKYEQGQMMPSPEVLGKLVEVLKDATWGASPLRMSDRYLDQARMMESPVLFRTEAMAAPGFRRAGLLSRLMRKGGVPNGPAALAEARGQNTRCLVCLPADGPVELREPAAEEGFSEFAVRRARCVRLWDSCGPLEKIRFRAGEKLAAKTDEALRYRIAGHLHKCLELESVLGLTAAFENPVGGRPPARSREEVEASAEEARRRWELGSGPIVNLLGLLEDKGIPVCEIRGLAGFEGLSGRYGDRPFVAVSMEHASDGIRLTAAHELGHMLCDFGSAEGPESECRHFGAAFLLPRAALEKAFLPSRRKVTLGDLAEIKRTYGLSLQAIMHRAHGLGLASDRQLRSFRETLKARGWMAAEPVAYEGEERAWRFPRLLRYAVAAGILDLGRAADLAGVAAADFEKEIGDIF